MATKVSTELKNEVRDLRASCGIFIDLRKATEQDLLAYIEANKVSDEEIKEIEEEAEVEVDEQCEELGKVDAPTTERGEDDTNADYWEKWNATYSNVTTKLRLSAKTKPEETTTLNSAALIGIVIAIAVIELFNLAVTAFELTKNEVVKQRLTEKGFGAAVRIVNQFKSQVKARGFAVQG